MITAVDTSILLDVFLPDEHHGPRSKKRLKGVKCDFDRIDLKCPGRRQLLLDFEKDLGQETGSGAMGWKLNPVDLRRVRAKQARYGVTEPIKVVNMTHGLF